MSCHIPQAPPTMACPVPSYSKALIKYSRNAREREMNTVEQDRIRAVTPTPRAAEDFYRGRTFIVLEKERSYNDFASSNLDSNESITGLKRRLWRDMASRYALTTAGICRDPSLCEAALHGMVEKSEGFSMAEQLWKEHMESPPPPLFILPHITIYHSQPEGRKVYRPINPGCKIIKRVN